MTVGRQVTWEGGCARRTRKGRNNEMTLGPLLSPPVKPRSISSEIREFSKLISRSTTFQVGRSAGKTRSVGRLSYFSPLNSSLRIVADIKTSEDKRPSFDVVVVMPFFLVWQGPRLRFRLNFDVGGGFSMHHPIGGKRLGHTLPRPEFM